jgi:hypothetical protein
MNTHQHVTHTALQVLYIKIPLDMLQQCFNQSSVVREVRVNTCCVCQAHCELRDLFTAFTHVI